MDFSEARIEELEFQFEEQKKLNLQYQRSIKTVISDIGKLKNENKDLKEENKKLIDRINRYDAKKSDNSNLQRNKTNNNNQINDRNEEYLRRENNRLLKENQDLMGKNNQLSITNKELINKLRDYTKIVKEKEFYEIKYNEYKNESLKLLMNDPRLKNQIIKKMENEIKELKSDNEKYKLEIEKLHDQLIKKNDEESFDFNATLKIKKEKN